MTVTAWEYAARAFEPRALEHPDPIVNGGPAVLASALDPLSYIRRPHLDVIADAWIDIQRHHTDRLTVSLPSQSGKTTTAVDWAVFWWLIMNPLNRVAVASYGDSLSVVRGRAVRRLVESHGERFGLKVDSSVRAAHDWALTTGGGVLSVGVGSGFTGRPCDCVSGESDIITRDGVLPIAEFVRRGAAGEVLSYNHKAGRAEFRRVQAARAITRRSLVQITTARGRTLRCTPDHRIYVLDRGYVAAADLRPGDRLRDVSGPSPVVAPLLFPSVLGGVSVADGDLYGLRGPVRQTAKRRIQGREERVDQALLLSGLSSARAAHRPPMQDLHGVGADRAGVLLAGLPPSGLLGDQDVPRLPDPVQPYTVRRGETGTPRPHRSAVLGGLHPQVGQDAEPSPLPDVQLSDARRAQSPVLLTRVSEAGPLPEDAGTAGAGAHRRLGPDAPRREMRGLPQGVPASEQPRDLLLFDVREPSSLGPDAGSRQPPLQDWTELRETVPQHAASRPGARRRLRRVWPGRGDGHLSSRREAGTADQPRGSSHQQRPQGQPSGESHHPLLPVPRRTPQVGDDTVSVVRVVRGGGHTVYDLQVDGNRNFFAGGVLVHNCLIIDDPHKDRAEADSSAVRRGIHEWWSSVVVPRMAPGAPIVIVATRWHTDDLIGRVTQHEGTVDKGGRWRVISMPALCTDPKTDPLGRAAGEPLPHPRIPAGDTAALLRHWQERRTSMTPRDWQSICQCDPQPPGGTLLTGDELRLARHLDTSTHPDKKRIGVAVDPSGGGRDTAGIIGGYLGEDGRLWFSDDRSMVGPADKWARAAAQLAADIDADLIVYESNYGADMARAVIRTAWEALVREGVIAEHRPCPLLQPVHSRRGKFLRAEPVAQAFREDRIRTGAYLPEMESEWITWQPTSAESPGRIDASVHLAWALLPPPGSTSQVVVPSGPMPSSGMSPLGRRGRASGMSGFGPLG